MATLIDVLVELRDAEENLQRAYTGALELAESWRLTPELIASVHTARDALYEAEVATHSWVVGALDKAGVADPGIPEPHRWPDLPQPSPTPAGTQGLRGLGSPGLGAGPLVWAGLVLGILAGAAAAVYFAVQGVKVTARTFRSYQAMREDTARFSAQLETTKQRFDQCVAQTGDALACAQEVPIPDPPKARAPPSSPPTTTLFGNLVIFTTAAAAGFLGVYGTKQAWRASRAEASQQRARKRLRGYDMEVE